MLKLIGCQILCEKGSVERNIIMLLQSKRYSLQRKSAISLNKVMPEEPDHRVIDYRYRCIFSCLRPVSILTNPGYRPSPEPNPKSADIRKACNGSMRKQTAQLPVSERNRTRLPLLHLCRLSALYRTGFPSGMRRNLPKWGYLFLFSLFESPGDLAIDPAGSGGKLSPVFISRNDYISSLEALHLRG